MYGTIINRRNRPKPYCHCALMKKSKNCSCGEDFNEIQWRWEEPIETLKNYVKLTEQRRQVIFLPNNTIGTGAVRGDTAFRHNYHYYWEVKMMSEVFGTDIMVGIGTSKVDLEEYADKIVSLLGYSTQSYGVSYTGAVHHSSMRIPGETVGFCRGSIIGVRVDLWQGTLEFYINRKTQGISFFNLRRHKSLLYPMLASTAANSSMKLIYASSWKASLLVDALKILSSSTHSDQRPPNVLGHRISQDFWLSMRSVGSMYDSDEAEHYEPRTEYRRLGFQLLASVGVYVPFDSLYPWVVLKEQPKVAVELVPREVLLPHLESAAKQWCNRTVVFRWKVAGEITCA